MKQYILFKQVSVPHRNGEWYYSNFRSENKFYPYEQINLDRETYFGNNPEEDILYIVRPFLYNEKGVEIGEVSNKTNWVHPLQRNMKIDVSDKSRFSRDWLIFLYNE